MQQLGTIDERTLEYGLRYEYENDIVLVKADDTARHQSGSYYTPDSLVSLIIEKAVGPSWTTDCSLPLGDRGACE